MKTNVSLDAKDNPKDFYNKRYGEGYMDGFVYDVYEMCRVVTIAEVLNRLKAQGFAPASILDYGCGQGRYVGELKKIFPAARFSGCDISEAAVDLAGRTFPDATFTSMQDETTGYADSSFDLVISIEVFEHVQDVGKATHEVARLLRPGGVALITTPCANRFSAEWFQNAFKNGFEPSYDGYGRFSTDEPGHLRRLTDQHLRDLFAKNGMAVEKIYHRAHLFTALLENRVVKRRMSVEARARLALLDWHLFKHLPNGATLLAVAKKR